MEIDQHWTTLDVPNPEGPDEKMDAFMAYPETGGPWPGIVVFQEIFGVNEHIRDVCKRIAAKGYVTIAPDIYHRSVTRVELAYDAEGVAEGRKHKDETTVDGLLRDTRKCIQVLKDREDVRNAHIGAVGFCFGGHVAFLAATLEEIQATACFYGGGISTMRPGGGEPTLKLASEISGRILMLYGDQDKGIPSEQVEEVRNALAEAGRRYEVKVFEGAGHGFACDRRDSYHRESSEAAWEAVHAMWEQEFA